jgi:hypothetical protein
MILYVNGDSHTAAAEAVNPHAFAEDDPALFYLGRAPHPANLAVSWGKQLSLTLKTGFHCEAESGSSNTRIIRTTRAWLQRLSGYNKVLVIIQWSTWEREEWLHNKVYYQVGASGTDHVPAEIAERYRNFVIGTDWAQKIEQAHQEIWAFHTELEAQGIEHVFFNGNNDFSKITEKKEWGKNYVSPYDPTQTYDAVIRAHGCNTVMPRSWHFGRDGHSAWHRYMLNYLTKHKFV